MNYMSVKTTLMQDLKAIFLLSRPSHEVAIFWHMPLWESGNVWDSD